MAITISNNPEQFHPTRLPFCKWTSILSTHRRWLGTRAPRTRAENQDVEMRSQYLLGAAYSWLFALNSSGPVRDEGQRRRCCARDIDSNMSTDSRLISLCSRLSWPAPLAANLGFIHNTKLALSACTGRRLPLWIDRWPIVDLWCGTVYLFIRVVGKLITLITC